jgi:hypothetical protein
MEFFRYSVFLIICAAEEGKTLNQKKKYSPRNPHTGFAVDQPQ